MGTTADKLNKLKDTKARIKAAIEAKGVNNVGDVFGEYPNKIAAIPSGGGGSKWTGHADAEGLKAIGWTDEDIAYYQEHGVNWNEEDDEYHKVPQSNIELYGVINENNVQTYKDILVYLPKIKITKTSLTNLFTNFNILTAIPMLDTSSVTNMSYMFYGCRSLTSVPLFDTSNVTDMGIMFSDCYSLTSVPLFDTSNVKYMNNMFYNCYSLTSVPLFDTSKVTSMPSMFSSCYSLTTVPLFDTSNVTNMNNMFFNCNSLTSVPLFDVSNVTIMINMFFNCNSLQTVNIKNLKLSIDLSESALLSKESVLYMINNSVAESPITITLNQAVYDVMSADAEVQAALQAKPNVSLAGK